MEKLTSKEIANKAGGLLINGPDDSIGTNVVMDSREAVSGSVFVALKGENTDGHRFLKGAYDNGSRIFVISDRETSERECKEVMDADDASIILTDDSLRALQDLAENYFRDLHMDSIAVTGSVGKTSTRDMLKAMLATKYKVGANKKNFNSETGLPLTLLSFDREMEAAVLEMGMDGPGQIERLVEISGPRVALITNVGISHIERLGSREKIFEAKMEIATGFGEGNTLVINNDDDMLSKLDEDSLPYELVRVGMGRDSDYWIEDIVDKGLKGTDFLLNTPDEKLRVSLPIPGIHNPMNFALALAGAEKMGVKASDAIKGIDSLEMTGSRLRKLELNGITVVDDSYNAAPVSMKSVLTMLLNSDAERRIAILGGMNELGALSDVEHTEVGKHAAGCNLDMLITIGSDAGNIEKGYLGAGGNGRTIHLSEKEELYPMLQSLLKQGDMVVVKASRGYELDKLVEEIERTI